MPSPQDEDDLNLRKIEDGSEDVPDERESGNQFNLFETKKKLKEVFTFYASYGDRLNTTHLKSHKFHKML